MQVVVADPQADVRSAVRLLVTHDLGMRVVGEATDAAGLWQQLQQVRPDLLLLEWGLLGAEAAAGLARLHVLYPSLRVIVLSGYPEVRPQVLAAAADAFVSKTGSPEHLIETLRAVCTTSVVRRTSAAGGAAEESNA